MLEQLYPISYILSLSGLIFWFFFQKDKSKSRFMSRLFLGGFFVYLFSLAFAQGELSYKLLILFRDLTILGVVSQFFNFFKANKIAFFIMLGILFVVIKMSYWNTLAQTFPQMTPFTIERQELLLELKPGEKLNVLKKIEKEYSLQIRSAFKPMHADVTDLDDYFVVDIPTKNLKKSKAIIAALQQHNAVDWVEYNDVIQLDERIEELNIDQSGKNNFFSNDPGLSHQWGFENLGTDKLHRFLSKNNVAPRKKALIAILDTGVDAKHEDLKGNYRSIQPSSDKDVRTHGTHCAGVAAAVSNNGKGIASLLPNRNYVEVTSVRVLNLFGGGTQKSIIDGIIYAADHGADVISMSLGGVSNDTHQKAYAEAISYAEQQGAIVVVAAGNNNGNAKEISPANVTGTLVVTATDQSNGKASFSNTIEDIQYGVAAPGLGIYSTIPKNKYAVYHGTSMAAPQVAGLVGLMKSFYPELTLAQAYDILNQTGKETKKTNLTGRLIQPYDAIMSMMD